MHVAFDSQIFCSQNYGGISRYFASLAAEMDNIDGVHPEVLAPLHCNAYLKTLPRHLVRGDPNQEHRSPTPLLRVAGLLAGQIQQSFLRPDVLHNTYYYPTLGSFRQTKKVITVYDMIHERFTESFSPKTRIAKWKKNACDRADKIICISEHTRKDLLELYDDIAPEKVTVTHLGFDAFENFSFPESPQAFRSRVLGADTPYLLYVGNRSGYKNFDALLRAYSSSSWLRTNFRLLCFGGGSFSTTELAQISSLGCNNLVSQLGGADAMLAAAYRHAALFVYPSMYEGFGIPPLEAMSLDCPVICSDASSIPEIVGDAAMYFPPSDIEAIASVMNTVLTSDALRADLIERGQRRRKLFSWRRCAEETINIYKAI